MELKVNRIKVKIGSLRGTDEISLKFLIIINKEKITIVIAKSEAMFNEYCPDEITDLLVKISKVGLSRIKNNNPFRGLIKIKTINKIPKSIRKTKRG